ncbi:MAG: PIN domain-containing protein [Candidatus Electryonea clarkiae]|nr:PIN domain-containing protein [Candidatus Electryonea clarkiae]MDP8288918.1 PIN domain-containing protein [Candidatus Electryonea clarkiae]
MIHVILDSTIFRQDPKRKSAPFQMLVKLGIAHQLVLHIPYYVKYEFLTNRQEEYSKSLRAIATNLNNLTRQPLSNKLKDELEGQKLVFNSLTPEILEWVEHDFDSWCDEIGAMIRPIENHHGLKMSEMYFTGKAPFRKQKFREDFPDAFIYLNAIELANTLDTLVFVTNDSQLQKAFKGISNISFFDNLEDFIRSETIASVLEKFDAEINLDSIINTIKRNKYQIKDIASEKLYIALFGYGITDPLIKSDNHQAMLFSYTIPSDINLDFKYIEHMGGVVFIIPFDFQMDAKVHYKSTESPLYSDTPDFNDMIEIAEFRNRLYRAIEEELPLEITGHIVVSIDLERIPSGKSVLDYLDELMLYAEIDVSEIANVRVKNSSIPYMPTDEGIDE